MLVATSHHQDAQSRHRAANPRRGARARSSSYAVHVGRVGALALALGIGAAIVSTPGVAWADGEDSQPAAQSDDTGQSSGAPDTSSLPARHADLGEVVHRYVKHAVDDLRKMTVGVVSSTGGAHTSSFGTGRTTGTSSISGEKTGSPQQIRRTDRKPATSRHTNQELTAKSTPVGDPPGSPQSSLDANGVVAQTLQATRDSGAALHSAAAEYAAAHRPTSNSAKDQTGSRIGVGAADSATRVTATAEARPVQRIVSRLLTAIDMGATADDNPAAPFSGMTLLGGLEMVRRELEQLSAKQAPAVAPATTSLTVVPKTATDAMAADLPQTLAATLDSPPPTYPPIVSPDLYGTLADLKAQPGFQGLTSVPQSSWLTSSDGPTFTPPNDTGSGIVTYNYTVTRPVDSPDEGTFYVVTELVDYGEYGSPVFDQEIPILSVQRLDPGQSVSVQNLIVQNFAYPDGPSGPRETITEQNTYALIVHFNNDPFADDVTPPTAPTITTTDRTTTTVDLLVSGGTDDVGIVAYKIFRDGSLVSIVSPGEGYTDTGLNSEVTYHYTARAVDLAGNESPDSAPPLEVTTNAETDPGSGEGCDATHTCPDPNNTYEDRIEQIGNGIDIVSAALLTIPVVGWALSEAFDLFVGTPVGLVTLAGDISQYVSAVQRGDSQDTRDEQKDILNDIVGLVPGAGPLHGFLLSNGWDWPWA
jgi:hypothetical protein